MARVGGEPYGKRIVRSFDLLVGPHHDLVLPSYAAKYRFLLKRPVLEGSSLTCLLGLQRMEPILERKQTTAVAVCGDLLCPGLDPCNSIPVTVHTKQAGPQTIPYGPRAVCIKVLCSGQLIPGDLGNEPANLEKS